MRRILLLTLLVQAALGAVCAKSHYPTPTADNTATIRVTFTEPFKGKVYLTCVLDRFTRVDSADVDGSGFTLRHAVGRTDMYGLRSRPWGLNTEICLEPGCTYDIIANPKTHQCTITTADGHEQQLLNKLQEAILPLHEQTEALGSQYSALEKAGRKDEADSVQERCMRPLWESIEATRRTFATDNAGSFAAIVAAADMFSGNYEQLHALYERMDTTSYTYTNSWRRFKEKHDEQQAKWIQDLPAPDFTTTDINGRTVRLSDFRGQYVLLDFWASWCAPCRKKMKELKAHYAELRQKGITVFSVSGDHSREAWFKATREDGVEWTNTCDIVPFKDNKIVQAYHVTGVPTLFVISPDGRILKQNPSIDEILSLRLE